MLDSYRKTLMSESGSGNTNALLLSKEGDEAVQVRTFPRNACFATISYGIGGYRDPGDLNKYITHMMYDIKNCETVYSKAHNMSKEEQKVAKQMARSIFFRPYLRKFCLNSNFKDAFDNGLIISVKEGMSQEELFLGPYMLRHVWECQAFRVFIALRKRYKLTIHEATMLSLYLYSYSVAEIEESGLAQRQGSGHSSTCSSFDNFDYFLKVVYEGPEIRKNKLFNQSPFINATLGGFEKGTGGARWPTKVTGEGFYQKSRILVDEVVSKMAEYKKGLKNDKQA